jgi:hypothetical protein
MGLYIIIVILQQVFNYRNSDYTMQKINLATGVCVLISVLSLSNKQEAVAQSCNYFAGTAVEGQKVNLNTCSIEKVSYASIDFTYYLGNKKFRSQANCNNGTWTTFSNGRVHRPQSQATQNMLNVVCNSR